MQKPTGQKLPSQTEARGTFTISNWDEQPFPAEEDGSASASDACKLTQADVTFDFTGDMVGEGRVPYVMVTVDEKSTFVGMQRLVGRLGDRSGSFVLQTEGTYENHSAQATWTVVPGSGRGELVGLRGEGGYDASSGPEATYTLTYDFAG